jgi:hypothetical protein
MEGQRNRRRTCHPASRAGVDAALPLDAALALTAHAERWQGDRHAAPPARPARQPRPIRLAVPFGQDKGVAPCGTTPL